MMMVMTRWMDDINDNMDDNGDEDDGDVDDK